MALTKLTTDLENIQKLSDTPNTTEGLTADELKALWDKAGTDIQDYINDTLTVEADTALGLKVNTADIVNTLVSTSTTLPLSANQGKLLDEKITSLSNVPTLYAIATISSVQNIASVSTIILNTISSRTSLLTLSNNGIRIGAGISYVRISGEVFGQDLTAGGYMHVKIQKNNYDISTHITSIGGYFAGGGVLPFPYPVSEGDIITLLADSPGGGQAREGYENTWLGVEIIK